MTKRLVSDVVRAKAVASGASRWLDELPELIRQMEGEWSITVGRPFEGGTEAFVAEAMREDGLPTVLKLLIPRSMEAAADEITVLRLTDGEGCVRLLRSDAGRGAMLLERLGRTLHELQLPLSRRHEILCDLAVLVWRPAAGCGLATGAEKGRWLAEFISATWERIDRPCSTRVVDHALVCASRRMDAHDDERAVLVHGDVHQWNALESVDGFRLVDPDGLLAEPEYDLGVFMREDPLELLTNDPRTRARWLAARTGLDETAIWEWGVVERVSTGLLLTEIGLQPVGHEMLATAEHIARTTTVA